MTRRLLPAGEEGAALLLTLMATVLLTALAAGVVMVSTTEVRIASNYNAAQEALYAADAAAERAAQDLALIENWSNALNGSVRSSLLDGAATDSKALPTGGAVTLCCGTTSATSQLQRTTDTANLWGANNPRWKLFGYAPLASLLTAGVIDSRSYVAAWVADDPAEADGDPDTDTNGILIVHAEAFGSSGARKAIEMTIRRTSTAQAEWGQIAQRGQGEQNQSMRAAAVQTPGRRLSGTRMNTATGSVVTR